MKEFHFEILTDTLIPDFCELVKNNDLLFHFHKLQDSELSVDTFSFYISVAAVYSSKIEGENIELDSFIKHKRFGIEYLPDYTLRASFARKPPRRNPKRKYVCYHARR
jgi:hypothetical protein